MNTNSVAETFVSTIHAPAPSLAVWLDRATRSFGMASGETVGAVGRLYDADARRAAAPYAVQVENPDVRRALAAHEAQSQQRLDFLSEGTVSLRSVTSTIRGSFRGDDYLSSTRARFLRVGVDDMLHVTVSDGDGMWVTIGLLVGGSAAKPWSHRTAASMRRQLGAALFRQRQTLRVAARVGECPEGNALQDAARSVDAEVQDRSVAEAHAVWTGLLCGTWTVLASFDEGARRYIVTVPAPPGWRSPAALTPAELRVAALAAEGHSNKWIAYEVGVATTTVATQVAQAQQRLNVLSRAELAASFHRADVAIQTPDRGLTVVSMPVPSRQLRATRLGDNAVVLGFSLGARPPLESLLSPAQYRVVALAVAGWGDREIAAHLSLSRHTVSNQLRSAYARLGVGSRFELCARYARMG